MLGVLQPISLVLRAINKAFGSAECSVHWRTVLCEFVLCLVLTGRWPLLPLILTNHPWSIGWQDWQPRQPLHIVDLVWQASTLLFSKVLTPNYILTAPDDYEPVFKEASTSVRTNTQLKITCKYTNTGYLQAIYMQNFSLKRQACQVFFIFLVKTSGPEASLLRLVCREKRELFIHEVFNLLPHCGTWANSPAYSFCAELWFACVTDSLSFFFWCFINVAQAFYTDD